MSEQAKINETVQDIVLDCIQEVTTQGWGRIQIEQGAAANILAGGGYIDSLGLTSLLIAIEQDIEAELGFTMNLTSTITEITPSSTNPLATVGSLTDYIVDCIHNATVCGGV